MSGGGTPCILFATPAHFYGEHIQLDEPTKLDRNARLVVTVFAADDEERESMLRLSSEMPNRAYGDEEPKYRINSA